MKKIEERVKNLPPSMKKKVEGFVDRLLKKHMKKDGNKNFRRAAASRKPRQFGKRLDRELSAAEQARIIVALDRVAALSVEAGPPVSNRDHDFYLYGGQ